MIARTYQLIPVQVDLIRGIRYIIPFLLLFCLWSLVELEKTLKTRKIFAVVGVLLVAIWIYQHPSSTVLEAMACWRQGQLVCVPTEYSETIAGLEAIKQLTPPEAKILPVGETVEKYALPIRYYALRPIVYSYKDGGALAYANHADFLGWYHRYQQVKAVKEEQSPHAKVKALIALSKQLSVQYCLIESSLNPDLSSYSDQANIIYTNSIFTLVKISHNT